MLDSSIINKIGGTPLIELAKIKSELNIEASIFAKLESENPGGSIKDRVALEMINDYKNRGLLNKDSVIIEPTSGNTGIGLSLVCSALGYKVIIVMPDNMSRERIDLMRHYGAEVVLTDGSLGMSGAISRARQIQSATQGSIIAGQFENPSNPMAHYKATGKEIYDQTGGKIDIFVCSVGTGGTLTGCARYLKEQNPKIKIVALEPYTSAVLSGEKAGAHGIQGIGAGFIPSVLDTSLIDEVIKVKDENAIEYARLLYKKEGYMCGISSGANIYGACALASREENRGKSIVTVLPDTGERYLSLGLF